MSWPADVNLFGTFVFGISIGFFFRLDEILKCIHVVTIIMRQRADRHVSCGHQRVHGCVHAYLVCRLTCEQPKIELMYDTKNATALLSPSEN